MMDGEQVNSKLFACRYCLKVVTKRWINLHEKKCNAVKFVIPDGYTVEKIESRLHYCCPCGFKGKRYRVFDHMQKCQPQMALRTAKN